MAQAKLSEDEIMIRAREAAVAECPSGSPSWLRDAKAYRDGCRDTWHSVRAAARALRDIVKQADPDWAEALLLRDEAEWNDDPRHVQMLLKAIKRGRELAEQGK